MYNHLLISHRKNYLQVRKLEILPCLLTHILENRFLKKAAVYEKKKFLELSITLTIHIKKLKFGTWKIRSAIRESFRCILSPITEEISRHELSHALFDRTLFREMLTSQSFTGQKVKKTKYKSVFISN